MDLIARRFVRLAAAVAVSLATMAGPALADEDEPFHEPGINYVEHKDPYIQWIAGAVIIAGCLVVAFKNPHRTHLD